MLLLPGRHDNSNRITDKSRMKVDGDIFFVYTEIRGTGGAKTDLTHVRRELRRKARLTRVSSRS